VCKQLESTGSHETKQAARDRGLCMGHNIEKVGLHWECAV